MEGQMLNTNADTIAQEIAQAMSPAFYVELIYSFEKSGVLLDVEDESSRIPQLDYVTYQQLRADQVITAGMIPKLDNAFSALQRGVRKVIIGQAEQLEKLIDGEAGTSIVLER